MPSLYETTVNTGEVSSSNFTTLYNASGLSVPDAGSGQITGNLNVGGNLTVQGSSLLVGPVQLQDSLCLPNYCFPVPDGTTDQVLVTDGSGNVTWANVQSLPGANYTISASATTGGANLDLVSGVTTDSVKFAGSAHITVTQTDASTITISTDADNIPDGTGNGQVLVWENSAWTASSNIKSTASADRLIANYANSGAGVNSALFLRKDYTTSTYTTNDGVSLAFQLDSDTQATNQLAIISAEWNATAPIVRLSTNINNNTLGPFVTVGSFTSAQATLPGDLAVNGGDITTTATTASVFNTTATTLNIGGAATTMNVGATAGIVNFAGDINVVGADITAPATGIANLYNSTAIGTVNIGNSVTTEVNIGGLATPQVQIKPNTIVGAQTTQNVFNTVATTVNAFGASTATNIGAATGTTTIGNDLYVNGEVLKINANNTAADSYLYFKDTSEYLKWDNTNTRFQFSDQLYITETDTPAIFEKRNTTATINTPYESKPAIQLIQRVTDAADNDTVIAGPAVLFSRTSGATATTEQTFANFGATWNGTIADVNATALTSANNGTIYKITSVGSTDFTLIGAAANTVGTYFTKSGGTGTGSGTAKQYDVNISLSWSPDNFAEPTPGSFSNSPILLNLSGNDAFFKDNSIYIDYTLSGSSKVGINKSSPANTLDVGGNISMDGETLYLNYDKTNANVNINFGRVSPSTNAVIRWNSTSNTFEWSEDGSTWHQFIDATLTAPFYNGQLLSYLNGEWINDNKVTTTDSNERNVFSYRPLTPVAGPNTSLYLRKDYSNAAPGTAGVGTYTTGAGSSLSFSVVSDTQAPPGGTAGQANTFANITGLYSATVPTVSLRTSINNGVTNTSVGDFTTTGATLPSDLAVNGGDITTTVTGTATVFNTNATQLDIGGAATTVNIGAYSSTESVNVPSLTVNALASTRANTTTTTSTAQFTLDSTTRQSMKTMIDIIDNVTGETHVVEALAMKKGTTAYITTYAEMYSASALANFTADVSGGSLRIRVTPVSANSTTFNFVRTSLD